jgi:hypothetical protein
MKKCFSKLIAAVLCVLLAISTGVSAEADSFSLNDGSQIKGRVMSATASEVTMMTDFGLIRIALEKLTPESRAKITDGTKPDLDALLKKIAELEAKNAQLQQENEALRRQALAAASPGARSASSSNSFTPSSSVPQQPASGGGYSISSTGKRHNSGCRYFGSGRSCGPTDGVACKICGG